MFTQVKIYVILVSLSTQLRGFKMTKTEKAELAKIINSLEVAHICKHEAMNNQCYEKIVLWENRIRQNTIELGEKYGIELPCYQAYKNELAIS